MGRFTLANVYVIAGLATLEEMIQGFDVTSMAAIIGTRQVWNRVRSIILSSSSTSRLANAVRGNASTKPISTTPDRSPKGASRRARPAARSSARFVPRSAVTAWAVGIPFSWRAWCGSSGRS